MSDEESNQKEWGVYVVINTHESMTEDHVLRFVDEAIEHAKSKNNLVEGYYIEAVEDFDA